MSSRPKTSNEKKYICAYIKSINDFNRLIDNKIKDNELIGQHGRTWKIELLIGKVDGTTVMGQNLQKLILKLESYAGIFT